MFLPEWACWRSRRTNADIPVARELERWRCGWMACDTLLAQTSFFDPPLLRCGSCWYPHEQTRHSCSCGRRAACAPACALKCASGGLSSCTDCVCVCACVRPRSARPLDLQAQEYGVPCPAARRSASCQPFLSACCSQRSAGCLRRWRKANTTNFPPFQFTARTIFPHSMARSGSVECRVYLCLCGMTRSVHQVHE